MSPRLLLALFAVFAVAPGLARADIPEMLACVDKTDNAERLACYDAAAGKLKKQMGEAEKRSVTLFGFKLPSFDGSEETNEGESLKLAPKTISQIDSTVKSTTKDLAGHLIVTLANGQSWRLDDYRPTRGITVAGTQIQIVRNVFGGFYMGVDGQNNELSVIRVK